MIRRPVRPLYTPLSLKTESQLIKVFPDLHIIRSIYTLCVLEKHSNQLEPRDVRLSGGLG
jgi:hypothetical protein